MKSTIAYVRQINYFGTAYVVGYTGSHLERRYTPKTVPATVLQFVNDPSNLKKQLCDTTTVFYRPAN